MIQRVAASIAPVTLPIQAWGPQEVTWLKERPPVWVWISWPNQVAERLPGFVLAMNDRVVIVEVKPDIWSRWQPVVWRNAVTRRVPGNDEDRPSSPTGEG